MSVHSGPRDPEGQLVDEVRVTREGSLAASSSRSPALPLLAYVAVMWAAGFAAGRLMRFPYPQTASMALTVASNDFELAIAVTVGVFGVTSGEALAGVVGPLIRSPRLRQPRLPRPLALPHTQMAHPERGGLMTEGR